MNSKMLLLPVISQPGAKLALLDCAWVREKESRRVEKRKKTCWCVDASYALGHDTKPPLKQAAVGCRTDIIFNEIITYTETMHWLGSVPFHAWDLGICSTNRHDLASSPHLLHSLILICSLCNTWYNPTVIYIFFCEKMFCVDVEYCYCMPTLTNLSCSKQSQHQPGIIT